MPSLPCRPRSRFGASLALGACLGLARCSVYESSLLETPVLEEGGSAGDGGRAGGSAGTGPSTGGSKAGGPVGGTASSVGGEPPSTEAGAAGAGGETSASCDDRMLNGDEVDVDCGGSCPACPGPSCSELVPGPTPGSVLEGASLVGWYRFDEAEDLGADASASALPALSVTGVTQASDAKRGCIAVFDGEASLTLPASVTTDMTLAIWVQTVTPGLGLSGGHWYTGTSLLNAEMPQMVNDFGLSLVAEEVAFGVGNPDLTVHGGIGIDDGAWHQLVATRSNSNGEMVLYVDAIEEARELGPVGARTAATAINVGPGHLVAHIADIRFYDKVLNSTQVALLLAGK